MGIKGKKAIVVYVDDDLKKEVDQIANVLRFQRSPTLLLLVKIGLRNFAKHQLETEN